MKLLLSAVLVFTAAGVKSKSQQTKVTVSRYDDETCDGSFITDSWEVDNAASPVFQACTPGIEIFSATTSDTGNAGQSSLDMSMFGPMLLAQRPSPFGGGGLSGGGGHQVNLAQHQKASQGLQLTCISGAYKIGVYSDSSACGGKALKESLFSLTQSALLAAGGCAKTQAGTSFKMTLGSITLPDCSAGVTGDPHLTNVRGEKFDIHDGSHRLVHYPRGAPKEEALLMVDARAIDMGKDKNCYSVYIDSVNISGKWVGDEISLSSHAMSSHTSSTPSDFFMSFASGSVEPTSALPQDAHLNLDGMMPITATTSTREASGDDPVGGQELTIKIGERQQHPVLVQVWSSLAKNELTHDKKIGYLNVQVKNLPADSGGIIGLDSYSRPFNSQCELVQEEEDLVDAIQAEGAEVSLLKLKRPRWTALATALP